LPEDAPVAEVAVVDDRRVLAARADGRVTLWDVESGKALWARRGHDDDVTSLAVATDGRYAASSSEDGTVRLWRIDTGASLTLIDAGGEWLVFDDDGYFDASKGGGALIAAIDGDRAYRIDQLALRNNRPDLLLERMGLGDAETRAHFRTRHERRLARAKIDPSTLASAFRDAPTARILEGKQVGKWYELTFELAASDGLRTYNVWANGVPTHPAGKVVTGKTARITERVELIAGSNKLEVGATGKSGAEALRPYRSVTYEGATGELYYIGFGVSRYRDSRYDLAYAHKDALDLGDVFRKASGFARVHVATFVDGEATVANVKKARRLVAAAKPDDTVVVFVAGHGVHARDKAADFYYATHELDVDDLPRTAAPFELIEEVLQGTGARRKVLLIDTCESGELDPGEEKATVARAGGRGLRSRALVRVKAAATPARRAYLRDRDRFIYHDSQLRSGAVVVSSSRGSEVSYELSAVANGVFTEELLRALTATAEADADGDGMLTLQELARFVGRAVPERTHNLQHPAVDRDNPDMTTVFPLVPSAAAIVTRP
jgi:hypothetical protein